MKSLDDHVRCSFLLARRQMELSGGANGWGEVLTGEDSMTSLQKFTNEE
jgi:hypothetical protein